MKKITPRPFRRFSVIASAIFLGLAFFALPARQANAGGFSFALNTGSTSIGIGIGDGGSGFYIGTNPGYVPIGYVEPAPLPPRHVAPRPLPPQRLAPPAPAPRHGMKPAPAPRAYPPAPSRTIPGARGASPAPRNYGPAPTPQRGPAPGGPRTQPGGPRR